MLLTFFRHGSNSLLTALVAAISVFFAAGYLPVHGGAIVLGALIFFVAEYMTHRFAFHAAPSRFAFIRSLQHRMHYDHHTEPGRLDLLFLPWWFVIPVTAAYALTYYSLTRSIALTLSLLLGNLIAMLYYEWVHYVAHIPYVPVTAMGRWMKKYHLLHHYLNERLWFGVTNPSMDLLAHTYMSASEAERSTRTRVLYP